MADKKAEALKIVEEGLKELESAKGSVTVGVQKLSRAADLLDETDIYIWAQIQLANPKYIDLLEPIVVKFNDYLKTRNDPNISASQKELHITQ